MNTWAPVSSTAYGANAVYIPEFGKPRTLEFILVMYQNYPNFKTHPALDISHGYTNGIERFEGNHEMRIVGWEIHPDKKQWSFQYFPTMRNDVRVLVTFSADSNGRMRMELNMENPSDEDRQWEFHLYINPCEGLDLPGFSTCALQNNDCQFQMNGIEMKMISENISFWDVEKTDSNFWINFPLNVECCKDPCNPRSRYKERLKIRTRWIDLPANSSQKASIDFFPDGVSDSSPAPEAFHPGSYPESELPWQHMLWEVAHNHQYTRSFANPDQMCFRQMPARQWGKFFIWDCGMTAAGVADVNEKQADDIITEMPDPILQGDDIFNHGSFIITAVYALWELYRNTSDITYVEKHYEKLKRLVLRMFDTAPNEDYEGMVSANRGTGADDSPALYYAKGFMFAWDYQKTLPMNPDHEEKSLICIGMTAHALRELKILRSFASLLDKQDDILSFSQRIDDVERVLNQKYWSEQDGCYLDRVVDEDNLLEIPWVYDYFPLFSGSVPQERTEPMFKELMRDDGYFTPNGFTIIKPDSPYYRSEGYPNGSIWPPLQYLFWKTCINLGEMDAAKEVASRYFNLYDRHHRESWCCCEHFRAETGRGDGNMRFTGFVTPIVAMHQAHHTKGALQTGYETLILSREVTEKEARLELFSPFFSGKTGLSIVLEPNRDYLCYVGDNQARTLRSDQHGWIGLDFHIEADTKLTIVFS